jgi:hypothetical protein
MYAGNICSSSDIPHLGVINTAIAIEIIEIEAIPIPNTLH